MDYVNDSKLLKALAHPVRLMMAEGLLSRECHVDKMVKRLNLPQSTVSQHLGILKNAGILETRKEGVKTCYRVVDKRVAAMLKALALGIAAVIFAVGLPAPRVSAQEATLTLEQFSQKVVAYYPKLKAAHSDVDMALARAVQARAGFWPSLDISAGYKVSNDPVDVFGTLLRQERFTSSDFDLKRLNTPEGHQDFSAGVHVELPLFDAMQTIGRTRAAREELKATESDEVFTRMEALLVAQDAYLNAWALQKIAALAREVDSDCDKDLQKAADLKDKGMVLGADYYSARVTAGDIKRVNNELGRQVKAMDALLNILMGEPTDKAWMLSASLKDGDASVPDAQELLKTALASRPDLAALDARLKASDAELVRARSTVLPSLIAFGDADSDRNKIGTAGGGNFTFGVKARMPLFDPARDGRVRESRFGKDRLEHDIRIFKDRISRDITEEAARNAALRDNMGIVKSMGEDAGQAVSLTVPLYNEGRKSIADLLEKRRSYFQAAQAYHKALTGLWTSEARLLFLSGRLDEGAMAALAQRSGL